MTDLAGISKRTIEARLLPCPEGVEAYLVPVSAFPVPEAELQLIDGLFESLTSFARAQWRLGSEVFLQFNQFSVSDGAARFTQNARAWIPEIGLAVCPHDLPPAIWTREEFEKLEPRVKLRPLCHKVFWISAPTAQKEAARRAMLDVGAVVEIWTQDKAKAFFGRTRELLVPPIKESVFRHFPFYVPLLRANSFETSTAVQVQEWFCGATLYARESCEDNGIVIASLNPVRALLERAGVRVVEPTTAV